MRLSFLLSLPAVLSSVVSALAIERIDTDFYSVRTKMHKDMSGRRGDPKGKYFHESIFHPHYDGRFADKQLGYRERKQALSNLMQTYLATFADIGVETWLMHGTLLGWWWNRKILPWDSDSDVQVSEPSMHYLASYYNMTVFHYKTPRIPEGRDYMLEVNPYYVNREQTDRLNVIDARWVDTESGLFIDITTARYNLTHPAGEGMLSCKDGHEYRDTYIFPLRDTFFEGAPAKIPFGYKEILEAEYHPKALTIKQYENHRFDDEKMEWIPIQQKLDIQAEMKKSSAIEAKQAAAEKKSKEEKKAADKKAADEKTKKLADQNVVADKTAEEVRNVVNNGPKAATTKSVHEASQNSKGDVDIGVAETQLSINVTPKEEMPGLPEPERQKLEKAGNQAMTKESKKAEKMRLEGEKRRKEDMKRTKR